MRTVLRRSPAARPAASAAALLAAVLGLLLLLAASPASAAGGIDEASTALKKSQVYVDPAMTSRFSEDQAAALSKKLKDADKPIYVAVIPANAQYPGPTVIRDLRTKVGVVGVYAVWRGDAFKADSDSAAFSRAASANLAGASFRSHQGDINATLNDFVDQAVGQVKGHAADSGGVSTAAIVVPLALLALAGGGVFLLFRRAKKRKEEQARVELAQLRTVVDEDITAFGEELDRLDFNPGAPDADDAQRADYSHALDSYERAKQTMDAAKRPADVAPVTEALADGRFSLATLAARRDKRPLPDRRPPCFFDPRHGPSVQDVDWAPAGGAPRTVPACAADAARLASGQDPDIRTVHTEFGQQPYWNAGPAYSPWAGGYFGGGLLPGLLVGTALGSIISSPDEAWAAGADGYGSGFEGGDVSGADFNSSDFGGFDGGDFGDSGGGSDFGGF
ncbi:hypothetical protein [Kitasatospora sp. GP82]|uniref:hypothetical protein n=1 Tax=Kitasatospora sp. GP82 TaxID=3035089 RepID=UPI0024742EC7|nr:hypothetical protein [Kitasatospora sp. GP82]MDH6129680.1 hypothetical protein [Kitasatospora sp. GP82]